MSDQQEASIVAPIAQPRKRKATWPFLLIGMGALLVWLGSLNAKPQSGFTDVNGAPAMVGYFLGYSVFGALIAAVIVWSVLYFAVLKPAGRGNGGKYFAILAVFGIFVSVASALLIGMPASRGASVRTDASAIWADYQAALQADNAAFEQEQQAASAGGLLDPARLTADEDLLESKAMVARASGAVARFAALHDQRIAQARARVLALDLPPASKARALATFDARVARTAAYSQRYWELHSAITAQAAALVEFLDKTQGHWMIEDGSIAFERDADVEAFNRHNARLTDLARQLQAHVDARPED